MTKQRTNRTQPGVAITPSVICAPGDEEILRRHGVESVSWEDLLISGPAQGSSTAGGGAPREGN
jgi:hypothetical protein